MERFVVLWIGRKEGNVLFNGALNTFYLRLYVVDWIQQTIKMVGLKKKKYKHNLFNLGMHYLVPLRLG